VEVFLISFLILVVWLLYLYYNDKKYKEGSYYQVTKKPYSSIKYDLGRRAEYLTYKQLRRFENSGGKLLFNLLIPKGYNKTTEIDVLLICSKGLFVFECKDYSGWIFGNEADKNWTQTLPQGLGRSHKEYFYNPIRQNAMHIKYLKNLVGWEVPIWSVIVFSDKCTLKNITMYSNYVSVIYLSSTENFVTRICSQIEKNFYTEEEISAIYNKLYPCTQFDYEERERHIENIKRYLSLRII
jgi:hypothetical protein